MRTLSIYSNGSRTVSDGFVTAIPMDAKLVKQVDLSHITHQDFLKIRGNPHDDAFVAKSLQASVVLKTKGLGEQGVDNGGTIQG